MNVSHASRTTPVMIAVALVTIVCVGTWTHLQAAVAPPAPTNLTGSVSGSAVSLSWKPGAGTGKYVTYVVESGSASGATLAVAPTRSTSAVANSVADGLYWVRVRGQSSNGLSASSNQISVRVGCTTAPPTPTGFGAQVSGTLVTYAWQASPGATSYVINVGSTSGASNLTSIPVPAVGAAVNMVAGVYYTRVRSVNTCGSSVPSAEVMVSVGVASPPPPPPPATGTVTIFGAVDAVILGTCTAAQHDVYTVDGGDGFRYRTWHPQTDPSGCVYAHEHGDNPVLVGNAEIAASPVRFGYIGRRHPSTAEPNGHDEAHEGFKVFIANPGDVNDEGRVNRVYSRSVFHMGTGGPKRFNMPHHSAEIRIMHPDFGLKAFTQLMMNTGDIGAVCDPGSSPR